jgi:tetratricopeptide (TPR) repeat protein
VRLLIFVGIPLAAIAVVASRGWLSSADPQRYFQEAKAYADRQEWVQAWIAVRNTVKAGGGRDPEVQFLVGDVAMHQTPTPAIGEAIRAFKACVELKPDYVEAQRRVTELYVALASRYKDTKVTWQEVKPETDRLLLMDPSNGKAYAWSALVELGLADVEPLQARKIPHYEAAVACCRQGIERIPDALDLYRMIAVAYDKQGQEDKIAPIMDQAIAGNPALADAYLMKAGWQVARNKADDASATLKKGLEQAGENPRLYSLLGEAALRKRDRNAALESFTKALALDPKNEASYLRLCNTYRLDNDREKAMAVLDQGLVALPDSRALQAEQADLCLELGNLKKADELIEAMAKAAPDSAPVNYLRGKRAMANMQPRQAITYLEQARDKQPTPPGRLLLSRAYILSGELGAAERELEALLREQAGFVSALRALAEVQFRLHNYDGAARNAKAALDANPDDTAMRLLMAQTLVLRQRAAEGLKEAQIAADRDKDNPEPFLLMADIYQDTHRNAEAEAMYRKALKTGKNVVLVYQRLVKFLKDSGQQDKLKALVEEARKNKTLTEDQIVGLLGTPQEIERQFKAYAEQEDAPVWACLLLGRLYLATDRMDQAKVCLEKALAKAAPNSAEWRQAWGQLFGIAVAKDAYDKAAQLIEQMKKADPQAEELLFAEAMISLSRNDLATAAEQLQAVVQANRSVSQGHYLLGQVLARLHRWDEAVASLNKALELRPQLGSARLLLAQIYLTQGNYAGARAEAVEALKFDPGYVPAMDLQAVAEGGMAAWDKAVAVREEIARIVPNNVNNLVALGALHLQRHSPEKAEEVFLRAYALAPDNAFLVRTFAEFYAETNRAKQGEKIVDDYVGRHKDQAGAYLLRGRFTAKATGPAEAEAYFRKAAELAPNDPAPLISLGEQYADIGEWEAAAAVFLQAVQRDPQNTFAKRRLADVYMLQGKLDEAKTVVDQVLKADPKDAGALVVAGRIASRQDKVDEAKRCMEAALAIIPGYGEAKVRLAELYAGPEPLKALDLLAGIDPSDASFEKAMLLRADINTRRVLLNEAILDLRRLLDFRPTSVPARLALASKYMAIREPGRAADLLQQLSKERLGQDPVLLVGLGDALMYQQRYADALANYEQARVLKPELAEALIGEARCLVALGRAKEATDRVHAVMNQFPNEVWPRLALVTVYRMQDDVEKAFEALRVGLTRRPDWEAGYVLMADLLVQAKKPDDARTALATGLANIPKSVSIRAAMATIDVSARRYEQARQILKPLAEEFQAQYTKSPEKLDRLRPYLAPVRAYTLALFNLGQSDEALRWGMMLWSMDPTDIANANNMAWILATVYKDFGRATELIDQCLRLLPNHPQILDTKGWILFLNGRYAEAADNLLNSIKYGDNPEAHYHLGRVYEARERLDEARTEYRRSVEMGLAGKEKEDAEARLGKLAKP